MSDALPATRAAETQITFERIELAAGPRILPPWARDLHVEFMHGWGNRPRYKVRCRTDPLEFTRDGSPVWTWQKHKADSRCWKAERDGVAAVHYHGGRISMQTFDKHVRWIEKPSKENSWNGAEERSEYRMLATSHSEGYGGRHFDITMAECELPVFADGVTTMTKIEAGTPLRLRGPWHGGAPDGYLEISYDIDEKIDESMGWRAHRRPPWYRRGGYFGLYIKPEVFLDIAATFQPHLEWVWVTDRVGRHLEPLVPQTGLPKGLHVDPADCPGHDYTRSGSSTNDNPFDQCKFCGERRDPNWVSPYGKAAA